MLKTKLFLLASICLFFFSCEKALESKPASLQVNGLEFEKTNVVKYLNLPNGGYVADNPNFSITDPDTWTGNMAQYVETTYFNKVTFWVHNRGLGIATGVEVDVICDLQNGKEDIELFELEDIGPNERVEHSKTVLTGHAIQACNALVYWY